MINYSEWPIVYEDRDLNIKRDPMEPEGYGLMLKANENFLSLPRGTLRDIARIDRDSGARALENLMPLGLTQGGFFEGTKLTPDSLIAAITKAHLKEEEDFRVYQIHQNL
ncbi:hypothetical protein K9L16_03390 [Candidatus Pacearchaeota archaeon]|nr:hypothetical protein [Candidatus Pacearchaeota archaeon]